MDRKTLIVLGLILGAVCIAVFVIRGGQGSSGSNSGPINPNVQQLRLQAESAIKDNELLKAKEIYQNIVMSYSDANEIESIQHDLEALNLKIILSNIAVPGKTVIHEVKSGDSLGKIAKQYGTTVDLIKHNNNLKADTIRYGQKLRVWQGKFSIYVDKSQNSLILKDGDEVVKVYTVSTGENNSSPVGVYKIDSKLKDPVWFNKGIPVPPESPQNVLGTRWMGFDGAPGYGIHGTIEPEKMGMQVTNGCVRMRNEEVEELFEIVPLGTQVTVVD